MAGTGLTLMGWFNADDFNASDQRIISKALSTGTNQEQDHWWMLSTYPNGSDYVLRFRVKAGGTTDTLIASSGALSTGQWYFASATYDAGSSQMKLFLNGVEVGSKTHSTGGAVSTDPTKAVVIGANPNGMGYFDGRIDEVAVYDKAITQSQLQLLFAASSGAYAVNEDAVLNVSAAQGVLANDSDVEGDPLTAVLVNGPSNAASFTLRSDGSFTYTPVANFNGTDSFTYRANDGTDDSNLATVTINVAAVNDAPLITSDGGGASASLAITENATAVTTVTSTDVDGGTPLYSLAGGADAARFTINSSTGALSFLAAPDYESPTDADGNNVYDVLVQVSDGVGGTDTQAIAVTVTAVNDNTPVITSNGGGATAAVNVAENATAVTTVTATDADVPLQSLSYSIDGGADAALFTIDSGSGALSFVSGRNRESHTDADSNGVYEVTVQASDGTLSDTQAISVTITDVDEFDVGAVADSNAAPNTVAENAGVGTAVALTGLASDADATATISYSLDDNAGGRFAIDANTGVVTVNAALDYETATSHSVTIRATSSDGSFSTQSFTIAVTDVNESGISAIGDTDGAADYVLENSANGTAVGLTAFADDPDGTDTVSYSLDDNAGGRFAIHTTTGVVTVAGGIDREAAGTYDITVRATSTDTSTTTRTFTITIGDVDEFDVTAPADSNGAANAVNENAANGSTVGVTASASDADATNNAVTYSLTDDAGGRFAIDANSGIVTVANGLLLDRESAASHDITVRATSADGSTADTTFTVNLNDVDEFDVGAVTDSNAAANTVAENAGVGTAVALTGLASDADATATISYSLDDNAGGRFAIDANTGVVTVNAALDYETATSHSVTIRATSSDGSYSTQSFSIAVTDVNESGISAISDTDAAADYVLENSANGATVGVTAFADDPDGTDTVSYSLDDNAGGRFAIHATTGVVTVAGGIDREAAGTYDITVRATSSDTTTTTRTFTITIGDVDEFDVTAPTDSNGSANAVNENAANGTVVGVTAAASDADATTNAITYSLADDAGGRFAIHATTGVVTVANGSLLDREAAASHDITVRATSADGSTADSTFTVNLNDVDEFDTGAVTDSDAAANTVAENAGVGTTVGLTGLASDADATNNSITYSLDDNAGGRFAIHGTTGVVTVNAALDYETAASHSVTIRATSSDGSFSTQSFTIAVTDVNESGITAISDTDAAADLVLENAANGTAVGLTAFASDPDGTDTVSYSLDDDASGRFAIHATTGVVTVAGGIDREAAGTYNITVRATSSDTTTTTRTFTITIGDVDEFDVTTPADSNGSTNAVNENSANGTAVGITASASDADATTNTITYSLTDNAGGRFAIDANTGVVTVANGSLLDREAAASHDITVRATSADGSTADTAFTINVNDVDEFDTGAVTDSNAAANTVAENAGVGTAVGLTGLASDPDATATISYSLDDDASGRFAIHATTGVVTVNAALDYEMAASHSVTIRATSSDGSYSTQSFSIAVTDVNESGISAISDTDAAADYVLENSANGATVGVTAFADDPDGTDTISYSLSDNAGGRFAIHATTGVVTVAGGIDREAAGTYDITVRATSSDTTTTTRTFTITIGDVDEFDVTAPTDSNGSANAVNENAANGTVVGVTAAASDADATTNTIDYSLTDDAGGRFAIHATTGVVTVANGSLLDREAAASHDITVRATSADGSTADTTFTVNLTDVDEFDTGAVTDSNAAANTVAENAGVGTAVGLTGLASDPDATATISYSLDDDASGRFAIHATTGVVTVNAALDYETATSHSVTIRATSSDGSFSTQSFSIVVTDVNESGITAISDTDGTADLVLENAANGTAVGLTAFADDPDGTDTVSYSLDDNAGGRFAIHATTGVVTVAGGIDREAAGTYDITVRATSSDTTTTTRTFTITIGDVDEFDVTTPADSNVAANAVDENAANGTAVGITAAASDADATTNTVTYSLTDNAGGRFAIDANSGVVTVANGSLAQSGSGRCARHHRAGDLRRWLNRRQHPHGQPQRRR